MGRREDTERRLELERRELAVRVDTLATRLTPDHLAGEATAVAARLARHGVAQALGTGTRVSTALTSALLPRGRGAGSPDETKQRLRTDTVAAAATTGGKKMSVMKSLNDDHTPSEPMTDTAKASVESLRAKIGEGLDDLPDAAKRRVLRAREAAIAAQAEVEAQSRRAAEAARTTARDNPLLMGALALAAGVAVGALLPRTSFENRTVGAHRDRLFDDAERIYREERDRLMDAAGDVIEEGRRRVEAAAGHDDPSKRRLRGVDA